MPDLIDLHLHSTRSDGALTPAEVVARAAQEGLRAVALADHDNVDGIEAAMAAGDQLGVEVIAGVELSVVWQQWQDVHLLGYGFDWRYPRLVTALAEFQAFRAERNRKIVERVNQRLAREGRAPIRFERVLELAGGTIGRPHVAKALIEAGVVADVESAFRSYLVDCNVPKRFFPADEAIDLIHAAGGVAVLAHPPFVTRDHGEFRRFLNELVKLGLDGVEVYNSGSSRNECDWYLTEARRRGLIVTGGSDYHGLTGENLQMGSGRGQLKIPYSCVAEIHSRCQALRITAR